MSWVFPTSSHKCVASIREVATGQDLCLSHYGHGQVCGKAGALATLKFRNESQSCLRRNGSQAVVSPRGRDRPGGQGPQPGYALLRPLYRELMS